MHSRSLPAHASSDPAPDDAAADYERPDTCADAKPNACADTCANACADTHADAAADAYADAAADAAADADADAYADADADAYADAAADGCADAAADACPFVSAVCEPDAKPNACGWVVCCRRWLCRGLLLRGGPNARHVRAMCCGPIQCVGQCLHGRG